MSSCRLHKDNVLFTLIPVERLQNWINMSCSSSTLEIVLLGFGLNRAVARGYTYFISIIGSSLKMTLGSLFSKSVIIAQNVS